MKKIITLLIFLFAGVTLAQTYTPYDKTEGRYWRAYKDSLLASYVYVVNDSTSKAKLDSIIAKLTALATPIATISNATTSIDASNTRIEGYTDGLETKADTSNARLEEIKLDTETIKSILDGAATFVSNNLAVTTAAPLHSNTACKKVIVTNYTAGEYVYVGNASVSTSNGFPLGYLDSITLTVSNLNLVYVVSDGTSCDIRFSYEN